MTKNFLVLCTGAMALGLVAIGGAQPALAQCLGPGVNFGGKNNGWTTAPCSRGGYSGGGGGGRTAAAIGAAGVAIGLLGAMMEEAAQQERNAADEESRRRASYCQGKYRHAYALNERGKRLSEEGQPEEAFQLFEQALATLGRCGSHTDLAKLRGNIDNARSEFEGLANPGLDKTKPPLSPGLLDQHARGACAVVPENSPAWQRCMADSAATQIMADNPATRDACAAMADIDRRNQCVFNRYGAELSHQDPNEFGDPSNCYWDEHGRPCHPSGQTSASADSPSANADRDPNSLRNKLRQALRDSADQKERARQEQVAIDQLQSLRDAMPPGPDRDKIDATLNELRAGKVPDAAGSSTPQLTQENATASNAPPPRSDTPPQKSSSDDAYESYMNGENKTTGGKNNGDLGKPGFEMSGSETRKEIDRLTAPQKE